MARATAANNLHTDNKSFATKFASSCTMDLVIEDTHLPVHKSIISMWSAKLAEHIDGCSTRHESGRASSARLQVPLNDSIQAVQDLLQLIYSHAGGKCSIDSFAQHFLPADQLRLQAIVLLAEKYHMPSLLEMLDNILVRLAAENTDSKPFRSNDEVVRWFIVLSKVNMPQFKELCAARIAKDADTEQLSHMMEEVDAAGSICIMKALMTIIHQVAGSAYTVNQLASKTDDICTHLLPIMAQTCTDQVSSISSCIHQGANTSEVHKL